MASLFEDNIPKGYRLQRFEFCNWGSFHDHIWIMDPQGHSTLLTGRNGSGKTTLVDALITLLVPQNMRHYNQSSGSERKKERTEQSYMLGVVGNIKEDQQSFSQQQSLRSQKDYSAMIGIFYNASMDRFMTLGQIRYYTNGSLQRQFFTCDKDLGIKEHILPLDDSKAQFKKRLQTQWGIKFYESFNQYKTAFLKGLGMRSEKALNLFSQTVGVKVLGDLNSFIRSHMLEPSDTEKLFQNLYTNYQTLLNTHRKIEKAEKQLELLEPVIKEGSQVNHLKKALKDTDQLKAYLPAGLLPYKEAALQKEEIRIRDREEILLGQDQRMKEDRKELQNQFFQIKQQLQGNEISNQINLLKEKMTNAESTREIRRNQYKKYEDLSDKLEMVSVKEIKDFQKNQKKLLELEAFLVTQLEQNRNEQFHCTKQAERLEVQRHLLEQELISLGTRKNNIPMTQIELRRRICDELELSDDQLPFAGELIRVREDQSRWRAAAERLLHHFALCLLVPDELYFRVNLYINSHNLRGRLVYYRVDQEDSMNDSALWNQDDDILPLKLEVKQDNSFQGWVWNYLNRNFDYHCVEQVDQLPRYNRALTIQGLIKRNNRHEKDDRSHRSGAESFVLGWNNLEKRKQLQDQLKQTCTESDTIAKQMDALNTSQKQWEDQRRLSDQLQAYKSFDDIDWFRYDSQLQRLKKDYDELCLAHRDIEILEQQLNNIEGAIEEKGKDIDIIQREIGQLDSEKKQIEEYHDQFKKQASLTDFHENIYEEDLLRIKENFQSFLTEIPDFLGDLLELEINIKQKLETQWEDISNKLRTASSSLVKSMGEFLRPKGGLLEQFPSWVGDTVDMDAQEESLPHFEEFYNNRKKEELPRYRKEFRKYLNERMQEDLIGFQESLDREVRLIHRNIDELNKSLRKLKYTTDPDTYIRLLCEDTKDVAIREFQRELKNARGDATRLVMGDEEELEHCFLRLQKLITRLKEEDPYRQKVLDLRYWLEFAAEEKDCLTDEQIQFYEDSNSLSGGEKAKWAYTILASAIAYQFGINEEGDRSFRFVIVDEAFSKVDPENSTYAMNLFKNLNLQLMVVTPSDKINLVEDYIESVHYVENRDRQSRLYKLGFQEYEEKKKEWMQQGE